MGHDRTYLNAILWHTHAHSHATLRTETFHTRTHLVRHGTALALLWRSNANADADAVHAHFTTHTSHHGIHHLWAHVHIAHFRSHHRIHARLHHRPTAVGHHGSCTSHNHRTDIRRELGELVLGHAGEILHPHDE